MSDKPDLTKNIFGDNVISGIGQSNSSVEIFGKVTDEIYSKKSIQLKTDLNDRQILAFSSAAVFARKYKRPLLKSLVRELSIYSVSRGRKGRKEFENIAKANLGMSMEDESRSIPDRLMGRR